MTEVRSFSYFYKQIFADEKKNSPVHSFRAENHDHALRIDYPYSMYLDVKNGQVAFQNREFMPLYREKGESQFYQFYDINLEKLPDNLQKGVESELMDRPVILISLYDGSNSPCGVEYTEESCQFCKNYFQKLFMIKRALGKDFIFKPRYAESWTQDLFYYFAWTFK